QATFFITFKDLVAGLPRNPELPAQGSHTLPILEPNYETHSFVHDRTFLPRHPHFRPHAGEKCNPCLRNVLLPMSRVGQFEPAISGRLRSIKIRSGRCLLAASTPSTPSQATRTS